MMVRLTWEGALKCLLRAFLLEEDTILLNFILLKNKHNTVTQVHLEVQTLAALDDRMFTRVTEMLDFQEQDARDLTIQN